MTGERLALVAVAALAVISRTRGSRALADEGWVDGHWGSRGVGVLLTTGTHVLLTLRSPLVNDPGVWGVPGGAVRIDSVTGKPEQLLQAAAKELEEETGLRLRASYIQERLQDSTLFRSGRFSFLTFVVRVPASMMQRKLAINWESTQAAWVSEGDLGYLDLHPGVAFTIDTVEMENPHVLWS